MCPYSSSRFVLLAGRVIELSVPGPPSATSSPRLSVLEMEIRHQWVFLFVPRRPTIAWNEPKNAPHTTAHEVWVDWG